MRHLNTLLLLLVVTALCLPLVSAQDTVQLTDPTTGARPFEGQELRILNTEVVPILAYQHQIVDPLYEEASGVTLIYENASHSDVLPRIQTACAAGGDDFDIMFVEGGWAGALAALGCLEELDRFYLAAPGDSHPEDFTTRAFGTVAMAKEKWVGIPTLVAVGMFAYRTDLFGDPDEQAAFMEQYGRELTVPQTWDELAEVGEFFTRPEDELWGFNYRYGTPNNILFDYMIHFGFSRGVDFFDSEFNPLFDTEAAIDTAAFFAGQDFLNMQPPGRESYQFGEVLQNFTQGKVAMYGTESWAIPLLLDPEASVVAEHTAFAPVPGWRNPETGEIQSALLSAGPAYMINARIPEERKWLAWDYLQLARAMVRRPEVFLMDEPLSNLDAKLRIQLRTEIKRLHQDTGATFIFVTHDQEEAMTLGDKIIVMDQGDIQQVGTPHEVFFAPQNAFVANFVGTPSMNMLPGTVQTGDAGGYRVRLPEFDLKLPTRFEDGLENMESNGVIWGIRPEAIKLVAEPGENCVSGTVELVEALGSRDLMSVRAGQELFGVIVDALDSAAVGDNCHLYFDGAQMHLFSADSERSLLNSHATVGM